jgi:hypothetical protein
MHRADDESDITWQKTYGGSANDNGQCIYQTKDGSFIIAGNSSSFATASQHWWLLKIPSDGTLGTLDCGMGDDTISSSDTAVTDGDTVATVRTQCSN